MLLLPPPLPSSADIAASRVVYLRSYHIICSWQYVEAFKKTLACDSAHSFNPGFLLPDSLLGKTGSKAELVQVNHNPIICLRNFIKKKLEIEKTKPTSVFKVVY